MKLDILAIGVHPDDVELSCSGTLLHYIQMGKKVGLLDLTRGELGSRGTAEIREKEATLSAERMGALVRENLGMADGFFMHTEENLHKIIRVIRKYQPEIVLANAVEDRHPDHARAAKLTADACFLAGLLKVKTWDEAGQAQTHFRPRMVFHYIQDYTLQPDFVVDITPYIQKKMDLILTFDSQFYQPGMTGPKTPISGEEFLESIKAKNRIFGRPAGFEFGEGFNVARPLGVKDIFDLS